MTPTAGAPNAGFDHEIKNFFVQAAVTPDLNVQAEVRHRESQQGDLAFNFDPAFFSPDCNSKEALLLDSCFLQTRESDVARVGVRYSPTPNSDVLLSYIHSDITDEVTFTPEFPFATNLLGSQVEGQYIYRGEWLNLIAGGWDTGIDERLGLVGFPKTPSETEAQRAYLYTNIKFPKPVTWTLGVSYDNYQRLPVEVEEVNPKFGVQWDVTSNLSVRAAAFQWVKPPLLADRTPRTDAGLRFQPGIR